MNIVECPRGCNGLIDADRTIPITIPRLDGEGYVVRDPATRKPLSDTIELPYHLVAGQSYFDKTGLGPASCHHGLSVHPDPIVMADEVTVRKAVSWVKTRYLRDNSKGPGGMASCPVCRGEPRPDDMTAGFVEPEPVNA